MRIKSHIRNSEVDGGREQVAGWKNLRIWDGYRRNAGSKKLVKIAKPAGASLPTPIDYPQVEGR